MCSNSNSVMCESNSVGGLHNIFKVKDQTFPQGLNSSLCWIVIVDSEFPERCSTEARGAPAYSWAAIEFFMPSG